MAITPTRVYFAARLHHAPRLRGIARLWEDDTSHTGHPIEITSTWIWQNNIIQAEAITTSEGFRRIWENDDMEVRNSHCLVLYAHKRDRLRGALIEAGIAIAHKRPVILVGDSPDFGTWQHHPLVVREPSFETAKSRILHIIPQTHWSTTT
jgi:hypothetical protein